MVQESLSGVPGFQVIADTQSSHVIVKDLWENSPQAVVMLLVELDVMGVSQACGLKLGATTQSSFCAFSSASKSRFHVVHFRLSLRAGQDSFDARRLCHASHSFSVTDPNVLPWPR